MKNAAIFIIAGAVIGLVVTLISEGPKASLKGLALGAVVGLLMSVFKNFWPPV